MITPEQLQALRALAERATSGPWEHVPDPDFERDGVVLDGDGYELLEVSGGNEIADAKFIAAANPAVVLQLLSEIERLRELAITEQGNASRARLERDDARRWLLADEERRKLTGDALQAEAECSALRARIAELEAARGGT